MGIDTAHTCERTGQPIISTQSHARHHRPAASHYQTGGQTYKKTHSHNIKFIYFLYIVWRWCGALVASRAVFLWRKKQMHHGDEKKQQQKKPTKSDTKPRQGVTIEWLLSSHRSPTTRTLYLHRLRCRMCEFSSASSTTSAQSQFCLNDNVGDNSTSRAHESV